MNLNTGYTHASTPLTRRALLRAGIAAGAAATVAPALSACSGSGSGSSSKTKVRIGLCQQALANGMPALMRKKFPDVQFEFLQANNSAAYYRYLQEHDDLFDILTVRRFSLRDAVQLKDVLVDLSSEEVASEYYQNYVVNYTYDDGVINWLPATAEIWCIVANKSLFEENNIAIPTDYPSFKSACEAFEALGITGFLTDWEYDYTSLETLEGFNSDLLQSLDGQRWRQEYESGTVNELDDKVWPAAFEHMYEVLGDTGTLAGGAAMLETGFSDVQSRFKNREIAMIRSSGSEMAGFIDSCDDEFIMLPYFGDTAEENWLLTYPAFQVALNANSSVDADLLLDIYTYMLGQEVQDVLNSNATNESAVNTNVLSYTSAVSVEASSQLTEIQSYIDANRVYTRLANGDFFTASMNAVQGMISGTYDAASAYAAFNETLANVSEEVVYDLNMETGYAYEFEEGVGSASSSALLNTCRSVWGTDLAVAYATSFSNSVYEGKASTSQLGYYFAGNHGQIYALELTGAQAKKLVATMVHYEAEDHPEFSDGQNPVTDDMLPVSSGFEMKIKRGDGEYSLESITIDGEDIDEEKTYSVAVNIPNTTASLVILKDFDIPDDATKKFPVFPKALGEYFSDTSKQLLEPSSYIELS